LSVTAVRRPLLLAALLVVQMLAAGAALAGDDAAPAAKRAAPPKVAPVVVDNVEFAAIPFGKARGLGQNGGYVAARDPATGKEIWTLKVYDVVYDPKLEGDVQDVFITELAKSASGHELVVTDEQGRRYIVDPKTRTVRPQ
jgi:hypothetical protein